MTIKPFRPAAAILALAALAQPQAAFAQQCVDQQDLADSVIYAMPLMAEAFEDKCGAQLKPDGFMATKGDAFVAPYRAQQAKKWPAAMRVLTVFAQSGGEDNEGGEGMAELFQSLPADAVRPFVDALIVQKLSEEIKTADCGKIERGVSLIAPLPPQNTGALVAFVFDLTGVDKPKLCPYRAK